MQDLPSYSVNSLLCPILSFALDRHVTQLPPSNTLALKPRHLTRSILNDVKEVFESTYFFVQRELAQTLPTSVGSISQLCDLAVWLLASCIPNENAGWLADVLSQSDSVTFVWAECVVLTIELIDDRTCSSSLGSSAMDDFIEALCDILEGQWLSKWVCSPKPKGGHGKTLCRHWNSLLYVALVLPNRLSRGEPWFGFSKLLYNFCRRDQEQLEFGSPIQACQ